MKSILHFSVMIFMLGACSSKSPEKKAVEYKPKTPQITTTNPKPGPDMLSRMLASEMGTNFVTEITFAKGSSELSKKSVKKLNELWEKARKEGKVDKIQFVTWSDEEYPSEEKKALEKDQKELAEKRNEALSSFFKGKDKEANLVSVSMAERVSLLGRVTASDQDEIKNSLQLADIATTADKSGVTNASKSIIMIFHGE